MVYKFESKWPPSHPDRQLRQWFSFLDTHFQGEKWLMSYFWSKFHQQNCDVTDSLQTISYRHYYQEADFETHVCSNTPMSIRQKKNCLLVLIRPTVLSGPTVKVFIFLFFFLFFSLKFKTVSVIRKRCWNCQQSIAHLHIGNWEFCSLQGWIHHSLIFMNIISGVENTVAKMADAMDTTDACTLAIRSKTWPEIPH